MHQGRRTCVILPREEFSRHYLIEDGAFANIMPGISNHFVHAQVRHFDPAREDAAWDWPRQSGKARLRPAASPDWSIGLASNG